MLLYERVRKNQFFSEDKQVQEGHTCTMTDGAEGLRSTSSSRAASAEATASSTTASQSDQCVFAADSKLGSPELLFEVMAANLRFQHDQDLLHDDFFNFITELLQEVSKQTRELSGEAQIRDADHGANYYTKQIETATRLFVDYMCNVYLRLGRTKRKSMAACWDQVVNRSMVGEHSQCRQSFISHFLYRAPGSQQCRAKPELSQFILRCEDEAAQIAFVELLKNVICVEARVGETDPNSRSQQLVDKMTEQLVLMVDSAYVKDRRAQGSLEHYFHLIYCIAKTGARNRQVLWSVGMVSRFMRFYHDFETAVNEQRLRWAPFPWLHASIAVLLRRAFWEDKGMCALSMNRTPYHPPEVDELIDLDQHPEYKKQLELLEFYYKTLARRFVEGPANDDTNMERYRLFQSLAYKNWQVSVDILTNVLQGIQTLQPPWIVVNFELLKYQMFIVDEFADHRRKLAYLLENTESIQGESGRTSLRAEQARMSVFDIMSSTLLTLESNALDSIDSMARRGVVENGPEFKRLYLCLKHIVSLIEEQWSRHGTSVHVFLKYDEPMEFPEGTKSVGTWLIDVLEGTEQYGDSEDIEQYADNMETSIWMACTQMLETHMDESINVTGTNESSVQRGLIRTQSVDSTIATAQLIIQNEQDQMSDSLRYSDFPDTKDDFPGEVEDGQLQDRVDRDTSMPGQTCRRRLHRDSTGIIRNHTREDDAVVPIGADQDEEDDDLTSEEGSEDSAEIIVSPPWTSGNDVAIQQSFLRSKGEVPLSKMNQRVPTNEGGFRGEEGDENEEDLSDIEAMDGDGEADADADYEDASRKPMDSTNQIISLV